MNTPAVVFDSPEDFDRVDAARAEVEKMLRSQVPGQPSAWFRPAGQVSTKTWVEVTGARIPDDYRILYPGKFVSFDETSTSQASAPKWDEWDEPDTLERICVLVVPNGAVLKKGMRHEANVYSSVTVNREETFAATLSVRTDGTTGTLFFDLSEIETDWGGTIPIQVGDAIRITWDTWYQNTAVTAVESLNVDFAGGGLTPEETELPEEGKEVVVTWTRRVELALVMVDVSDASALVRTTSVRNPDGDYQGYVQEWDEAAGGWRDGEEVWVRNAN